MISNLGDPFRVASPARGVGARASRMCSWGLAVVAWVGCAPPPGSSPVTHLDSAGVQVVFSSDPTRDDGVFRRVDPRPELVLGLSPPAGPGEPYLFDYIADIEVLEDHRIVVGNHLSAEVFVFDPTGAFLGKLGGRGQGPGEMVWTGEMFGCGSGDLLVTIQGRQLHHFDSLGVFVRTLRYGDDGRFRRVLGVSDDCLRLLVAQTGEGPELHSEGPVTEVFGWADTTHMEIADTVGILFGGLWMARPSPRRGGVALNAVPWSGTDRVAQSGQAIVVGMGSEPQVQFFDSVGRLIRIARWGQEAASVTRADRRMYSKRRRDFVMATGPEGEALFPDLAAFRNVPDRRPMFDDIMVDDESQVWLRHVPRGSLGFYDELSVPPDDAGPETWTVLAPTGAWLGALVMPASVELVAVANGRVFGIARDSVDVQTVVVHSLQR